MTPLERLIGLLRERHVKVTHVRTEVFAALMKFEKPVTVSELINVLPNVDKVSVYRTIELFETTGVVQRIWTGFKSKIELSDTFSPHHHHFTCQNCGVVTSFHSDGIEAAIHNIEKMIDASITNHVIELSGLCSRCSHSNNI